MMCKMAKLHETGIEFRPHPPYTPYLVPCDYYLFANLTGKAQRKKKLNKTVGLLPTLN